jgi:PhnB protein
MKDLTSYLTFDGHTREAMEFYKSCLGGELFMMTFGDSPMPAPPESKNRIMHAKLTAGTLNLMASDAMPGMPFQKGNNFSLALACDSKQEAEKLFAALGSGGNVTMPLQETFWAAQFGMVTDKFGVHWMINVDKPLQN